jgi:hypothetical protein
MMTEIVLDRMTRIYRMGGGLISRVFTNAATGHGRFDRAGFCAKVLAGGGRNPFAAARRDGICRTLANR